MLLDGIKGDRSAVHDTVLVLDGVLHRRLDHVVELVPVLPGPRSGGHFSDQDNQQAAEELKGREFSISGGVAIIKNAEVLTETSRHWDSLKAPQQPRNATMSMRAPMARKMYRPM